MICDHASTNSPLLALRAMAELVASLINRSNLLKLWEKTEPGEVSASGVYGPKNVAIPRTPTPDAAMEYSHVSDRSALV
jgi:hypothetical protein